ncbi:hypothetical protein DFH06DRAFT_1423394, partial [Mycena polygramma]
INQHPNAVPARSLNFLFVFASSVLSCSIHAFRSVVVYSAPSVRALRYPLPDLTTTTPMENDAPPMMQAQTPPTSTLEKLRASELHAVELEHQLALLRLTHAHTLEDLALSQAECTAVCAECNELRSECSDAKTGERRAERERDEVRGKYEGLKRRFYEREKERERERERVQGCKRKHEDGDGRERRESAGGEMDMDCSTSPPTPTTKVRSLPSPPSLPPLPHSSAPNYLVSAAQLSDPNTNRFGASIARKSCASSSCSSIDERLTERCALGPRVAEEPCAACAASAIELIVVVRAKLEREWWMCREGSAEAHETRRPKPLLALLTLFTQLTLLAALTIVLPSHHQHGAPHTFCVVASYPFPRSRSRSRGSTALPPPRPRPKREWEYERESPQHASHLELRAPRRRTCENGNEYENDDEHGLDAVGVDVHPAEAARGRARRRPPCALLARLTPDLRGSTHQSLRPYPPFPIPSLNFHRGDRTTRSGSALAWTPSAYPVFTSFLSSPPAIANPRRARNSFNAEELPPPSPSALAALADETHRRCPRSRRCNAHASIASLEARHVSASAHVGYRPSPGDHCQWLRPEHIFALARSTAFAATSSLSSAPACVLFPSRIKAHLRRTSPTRIRSALLIHLRPLPRGWKPGSPTHARPHPPLKPDPVRPPTCACLRSHLDVDVGAQIKSRARAYDGHHGV